jgi:hypothetical protein
VRHLRDVLVAAATAVVVAGAVSRVNREPAHWPAAPRHAAVLDEVIDDVELDVRTFRTAIDSLAARSRAAIRIDASLDGPLKFANADAQVESAGRARVERFRGVRLGNLLSRVLDQWGQRYDLHCRVEADGRTVTIYAPPEKEPVERRLYSTRGLTADWRAWRARTAEWRAPDPPQMPLWYWNGGLFPNGILGVTANGPLPPGEPGGGGGGLFGGGGRSTILDRFPKTDDEEAANDAFSALAGGTGFRVVRHEAGLVEVEATAAAHERIAGLLAMLSQGGSADEPADGGAR